VSAARLGALANVGRRDDPLTQGEVLRVHRDAKSEGQQCVSSTEVKGTEGHLLGGTW
jgi:hypothetical protein